MLNHLLLVAAVTSAIPHAAAKQVTETKAAEEEAKVAEAAMGRELKLTRIIMERRDQDNPQYRGHFSEALHRSQRSWRWFRMGHCSIEAADPRGGAFRPADQFLCFADLARKRAAELAHLRREG